MPLPHLITILLLTSPWLATLRAQDSPTMRRSGQEPQGQRPGRKPPAVPREQLAAGGWPIPEQQQATGDWWGHRDWLRARGIDFEAFLTVDASTAATGGVDPGASALRSLLDATVTINGERMLGWQGARFFADLQVQRGKDGSTDVGDLQAYSNIDGDDRTQLAVLWYEQLLFDGAVRLKIGKTDANVDFAFVEHGFRFLNSSFGYSPTIVGLPTYPDPAFGVMAMLRPGGGMYAGAGIYDGAAQAGFKLGQRGPDTLFGSPSDLFYIAEVGRRWSEAGALGPGRFGFGAFHHDGDFARFAGGTEHGTAGAYLVLDQMLWRPAGAGESDRGIGGLLQYGWADPSVSLFEHHVALGATWTGPYAVRPDDALGLGTTWGSFSSEPGTGLQGSGELAVELFYALQLTPWLRLKPDLQYIHNPGGLGLDDALLLTLRMAVTF